MRISNPFALRLRVDGHSLQLYYPLTAALFVAAATLVSLGADDLIVSTVPALAAVWPVVRDGGLVALVLAVMWLVWWSTIEFDRRDDRVCLAGWITVGRVSEIQAIERAKDGLRIVFCDSAGRVRRWRVAGVGVGEAVAIGSLLAAMLGVPFS